jgi:hypothetical protein
VRRVHESYEGPAGEEGTVLRERERERIRERTRALSAESERREHAVPLHTSAHAASTKVHMQNIQHTGRKDSE